MLSCQPRTRLLPSTNLALALAATLFDQPLWWPTTAWPFVVPVDGLRAPVDDLDLVDIDGPMTTWAAQSRRLPGADRPHVAATLQSYRRQRRTALHFD